MTKRTQANITLILSLLTIGAIAENCGAIDLRLRPEIGRKQTIRATWHITTSCQTPPAPNRNDHIRIFTVTLEPLAVGSEGNVTVRVAIQRIQEDSSMVKGGEKIDLWQFDSSGRGHRYSFSYGKLLAFRGETFTVTLSPQGRLLGMDTDAFYNATGWNRLKHEDTALRFNPDKKEAARRIKALNDKYGSPQKRQQAYAKEAPSSYLYGTSTLRRMLSYVLAPLAAEPVEPGDTWEAPVMIFLEGPMEMAGTHALEAVAGDACTIRVEARRTLTDKPGPLWDGRLLAEKLAGTYHATLKVDRTSGWLRTRQAVMNLTGTVGVPQVPGVDRPRTVPATIEAKVTTEPAG